MNLMKYDPFVSSRSLSNFFDSFFNRDIGDVVGSDFVLSHPSVNVVEQENAFLLELAAPGLKKNDFNVNVEKDTLTISAEKEMKTEEKEDGKFTKREFNYSSFRRMFHLPDAIDRDKITANYEDGVLRLSLPKKPEVVKEEKGRVIDIK